MSHWTPVHEKRARELATEVCNDGDFDVGPIKQAIREFAEPLLEELSTRKPAMIVGEERVYRRVAEALGECWNDNSPDTLIEEIRRTNEKASAMEEQRDELRAELAKAKEDHVFVYGNLCDLEARFEVYRTASPITDSEPISSKLVVSIPRFVVGQRVRLRDKTMIVDGKRPEGVVLEGVPVDWEDTWGNSCGA